MLHTVPVVDEGLGNSSYVVEVDDGEAVVVDPFRDPRPYLAVARERGWRLRAALETHLHADFVSGSRELADAAGTELWVPRGGSTGPYPGRVLKSAGAQRLGGLAVEVVPTPGHTTEHVAFILRAGDVPVAVFSGGTLIAGGVARPDLLGEELTEPLARHAYRSIHERLLVLPDDTPLYPTHGPGSFCSAGPSGQRTSTIGEQRTTNPLLQAVDEDAFVERLLGGLGTFPPYFLELRIINAAGPRIYGPNPGLPEELSPGEAEILREQGAEVIDVRSIEAFAVGHVPGSLSIALRAQFAVWLGWLVERDRDLVFVVDDSTDVDRLASEARKIGYERLAGTLAFTQWTATDRRVATVALLDSSSVTANGRHPLDVRQTAEWHAGHVTGVAHAELGSLTERDPAVEGPLLAHCEHGERAMTAASLLARRGHDAAAFAGGPADLAAALGEAVEAH